MLVFNIFIENYYEKNFWTVMDLILTEKIASSDLFEFQAQHFSMIYMFILIYVFHKSKINLFIYLVQLGDSLCIQDDKEKLD